MRYLLKKILIVAFFVGVILGIKDYLKFADEYRKTQDKAIELARLEYQFLIWFWDAMYDDDVTLEEFRDLFNEKMAYIEMVRFQ